jgi:hypothetical protein
MQEDKLRIIDRAAIATAVARHLSELVRHLETVARTKGRAVDLPEPLFVADLLRLLRDLEVEPAEFFAGVIRRWRRCAASPPGGGPQKVRTRTPG